MHSDTKIMKNEKIREARERRELHICKEEDDELYIFMLKFNLLPRVLYNNN